MSDLTRGRVQAIQKLAEKVIADRSRGVISSHDVAVVLSGVPGVCAALLEDLDTIDKARELHMPVGEPAHCRACSDPGAGYWRTWPCPTWQALNGGNEAEGGR